MADERAEALRRSHVRAIPLLELREIAGRNPPLTQDTDFVVGNPDARVRVSLAVFFVPAVQHPMPYDARYLGYLDAGKHGLAVMGRETPSEQGAGLMFCDPIFGTLSAPTPLPGDTFGWLVSDEPDCREWYCRLRAELLGGEGSYAIAGKWVARVTVTSRVEMSAEEWRRTVDKVYLRLVADDGVVPFMEFLPPPPA